MGFFHRGRDSLHVVLTGCSPLAGSAQARGFICSLLVPQNPFRGASLQGHGLCQLTFVWKEMSASSEQSVTCPWASGGLGF